MFFTQKNLFSLKNLALLGIGAIILAIAFSIPHFFWIITSLGLISALVIIYDNNFSFKKSFFISYAFSAFFWIAIFLISFFQLSTVSFLKNNEILISFFLTIAIFGTRISLWMIIFFIFRKHSIADILFGASVWVLLEGAFCIFLIIALPSFFSTASAFPFFLGFPLLVSQLSILFPFGGIFLFSWLTMATTISLFGFSKGIYRFQQKTVFLFLSISRKIIAFLIIILTIIYPIHSFLSHKNSFQAETFFQIFPDAVFTPGSLSLLVIALIIVIMHIYHSINLVRPDSAIRP